MYVLALRHFSPNYVPWTKETFWKSLTFTLKTEKSAFTKYKDSHKKDEEDIEDDKANDATPTTTEAEDATPTFAPTPFNRHNNLTMMQFPALRKLLDITGKDFKFNHIFLFF